MQSDRRARLIGYALILLAIFVQLQATVKVGGSELRANAADFALAALAPILLFALYKNFARLKEIAGSHLPVLLLAATVLLSFSLFRGYEAISGLSTWAAVKYAGWYILLFYLAIGALVTIVAGPAGKERFVLGFLCFQVVVIAGFIVAQYRGHGLLYASSGKLAGFAGNANAMAIYLICGFCLSLAYFSRTDLPRRWGMAALMATAIILSGILFTKSVSALLATICVFVFAAVMRVTTIARLGQVLALGVSLWIIPQVVAAPPRLVVNVFHKLYGNVLPGKVTGTKSYPRYVSGHDVTVNLRMEGYLEALAMWKSNPVFGAGLGVHLHRENLKENQKFTPVQIHSTGIWLLAETGTAGFLVMACIFVVMFHKVWSLARAPPGGPDTGDWFAQAVLLILVGWAVMSLFHELMYQRVVWLLVGMALTAPVEPLSFWKRNQDRKGDVH